VHERDNLQNNYINPYINALQEARNALGTISRDSFYYNVTIETKHTVRGVFGIKLDPKYTYHTERRFDQDGYNNAVGAANTRISNAENQLNVQKANYQGKIDTLNIEISNKQSSLYSPLQIQQALQTLNTANQEVASIGITLETSEEEVASGLQILNNASSALKSKQADLEHNEQKKGKVAEDATMTSNMINARESDLRSHEQKAHETDSNLIKKQAILAELEKEIRDYLLALKDLESDLSNIQKELLILEEASRAGELEIIANGEKVESARLDLERLEVERLQAEKLELERLEAERIKAEQLEAQRLETENDGEDIDISTEPSRLYDQTAVNVLGHDSHHNALDVSYSDIIQ
jgi:hypothetical protein